jgi:hypothetical protein
MEIAEISILIRLAIGAVGTFFAILLWSKSRDSAWVLVVIGTLISYTEIIFSTLVNLRLVQPDAFFLFGLEGFPLVHTVLVNLPMIFFTIAFIIVISRRRLP